MVAGVEPKAAGSVPPQSPTSLVDLLGRNVLFATLAASVQAKVAERLVRHDFPAGAEIPLHRNGQGWSSSSSPGSWPRLFGVRDPERHKSLAHWGRPTPSAFRGLS